MDDPSGYVYIAEQRELMSGHIKIGMTVNADGLKSRYSTYYPGVKIYVYSCQDRVWAESQIHLRCAKYRYRLKNELFSIDTPAAIVVIAAVLAEDAVRFVDGVNCVDVDSAANESVDSVESIVNGFINTVVNDKVDSVDSVDDYVDSIDDSDSSFIDNSVDSVDSADSAEDDSADDSSSDSSYVPAPRQPSSSYSIRWLYMMSMQDKPLDDTPQKLYASFSEWFTQLGLRNRPTFDKFCKDIRGAVIPVIQIVNDISETRYIASHSQLRSAIAKYLDADVEDIEEIMALLYTKP